MKYAILLNNKLASILRDHQILLSEREDYIQINGTDVQMQALGYPTVQSTSAGIQLDVTVRSKRYLKNHGLTESFAESGADLDEATQKAFFSFCLSSLHPILSAFVNRDLEAERSEWQCWGSGKRSWEVCLGPVTPKGFQVPASNMTIINPQYYVSFFNALRDAYLHEASYELHWLRIYYASLHGKCGAREVLLDNAPWQSGEAILDHSVWPDEPDFFSIRQFMIALPVLHEKKWWKIWS